MDDSDSGPRLSRRGALQRTLGAGAALGAAGVAGSGSSLAQQNESGGGNESGGQEGPDWGDWFSDVDNYESTEDLRGQDSVTVAVGAGDNGFQFDPPAIWVDPGTTVTWEWTGQATPHNVVHEGGDAFASDLLSEEGATFEHTFEEDGQYRYVCEPHVSADMLGGVAVGDVSGQGGGGDAEGGQEGGSSGGVPPIFGMIGAAFVVAFLSPLLFVLFLFNRGGDAGGEREYAP